MLACFLSFRADELSVGDALSQAVTMSFSDKFTLPSYLVDIPSHLYIPILSQFLYCNYFSSSTDISTLSRLLDIHIFIYL